MAHDTSPWDGLRLSTDRLCLRMPTPQDAAALYELLADAEVMHDLGRAPVSALEQAHAVIEDGAPFHIHFSDIQFANRNETKHLPYGEGTLRAEPLRDALGRFERPATVISESPTSDSTDTIKAILGA